MVKTYEIFTTNHSVIQQALNIIEAIEKAGNPPDIIRISIADYISATESKGWQSNYLPGDEHQFPKEQSKAEQDTALPAAPAKQKEVYVETDKETDFELLEQKGHLKVVMCNLELQSLPAISALPVPENKSTDEWKNVFREMKKENIFDDKFDTGTLAFVYAFQMGYNANQYTPVPVQQQGYSREQMKKCFEAGENSKEDEINGDGETTFEDYLQSLPTQPSTVQEDNPDVHELAEVYANSKGYQSDKGQFTTSPWTEWNIRAAAFIDGYKAASTELERKSKRIIVLENAVRRLTKPM